MKLKHLVEHLYFENDAETGGAVEIDKKMTEKTLEDTYNVTDSGLDYIKHELDRLNKKAGKLGNTPLELKILGKKEERFHDKNGMERVRVLHQVQIKGKSPIIAGYEFIASVEHTEYGNILNIAPDSSVKILPPEYRTAAATCDYCHTKRDRNNTFVLRNTATGEFKRIGRNCLRNFMPDVDPKALLGYAAMLGKALNIMVGGEDMEDRDSGGGGGYSNYYIAEVFLEYICLAYLIDGKYISGKKAKMAADEGNYSVMTTGQFARKLMDDRDVYKEYADKMEQLRPQAKELSAKVDAWKDDKDWDAEMAKNPEMSSYFNNMKVISNSPSIQYKNAGYHASLLGLYLSEKAREERAAAEKATPRTHIGKVGDRIEFDGTITRIHPYQSQFGYQDIYTFEDSNKNIVVWWTKAGSIPDAEKGKKYKVRAIVKKLDAWNGIPQTSIKNAKVTPI